MARPMPLVPETCPICTARWSGGCQVPGKPYPKLGVRTFYACGCQVSVESDMTAEYAAHYGDPDTSQDVSYRMKIRNCYAHVDWESYLRQKDPEGGIPPHIRLLRGARATVADGEELQANPNLGANDELSSGPDHVVGPSEQP